MIRRECGETLAEDSESALDARQGGLTNVAVNQKLLHDIQVLVSRLIGKTEQLLAMLLLA